VGDTAVENAADGDGVGHHECADLKGDDGVKCCCGAEIDEGKKCGDNTAESDCIRRNVLLWVDVSDPFGEWEAVVTGESEGLTSCGCVPGDICRDDKNEDHDCETVHACGVDSRAENVDERVAGWIVQCIIYASDGEEVGNQ